MRQNVDDRPGDGGRSVDGAVAEQVVDVDVIADDGDLGAVERELDDGVGGPGAVDVAEVDDGLDAVDVGEGELPRPGEVAVVGEVGAVAEGGFAAVDDFG